MATLQDCANFAQDPSLQGPLLAAIASAAVQIMSEAGTTQFHDQRVALATTALRSPMSVVDSFAWAVSTNTTIVDEWEQNNRTQAYSDIPFGVSSVWNAVAGAATPTVSS